MAVAAAATRWQHIWHPIPTSLEYDWLLTLVIPCDVSRGIVQTWNDRGAKADSLTN
ncbi:uncharacterized protein BDZ83DRAFT_2811 [Colletotrichum acutatum]|uniref:Uncharacterized protein n=1 Tax=Glomerella acutata TaxID=27357 RepID=A0AAD8XQY4_GLOAC|nr:uncharacterized protein BDZ83DRAFT_2811 [Colletotrichum acutatum]KAK1731742.1 hypothetical protein BDZ83DRAFT_2811 [Colletotrichum acutatum]